MTKALTQKQMRIRDFIAQSFQKRGLYPTVREIGSHFRISIGTVQDHVAALEAKGVVAREKNRSRGLTLVGSAARLGENRLPVLGQVPAGLPIEAIEHADDTLQLDAALTGRADYLLRVKGDSMEPEIHSGDLVLVRQSAAAENGEIIVALLRGDETTVKRLRRSGHAAWLEAANSKYGPIRDSFQVSGKIVGLLRHYGRG
jgi:repressor LexA